jgi:hypothetical protein
VVDVVAPEGLIDESQGVVMLADLGEKGGSQGFKVSRCRGFQGCKGALCFSNLTGCTVEQLRHLDPLDPWDTETLHRESLG